MGHAKFGKKPDNHFNKKKKHVFCVKLARGVELNIHVGIDMFKRQRFNYFELARLANSFECSNTFERNFIEENLNETEQKPPKVKQFQRAQGHHLK